MKTVMKRLAAVERMRRPPTPWELRSKAERDADVAAVLNDPLQVRAIMVRLVGEGSADARTAATMSRRAATLAAMRADT